MKADIQYRLVGIGCGITFPFSYYDKLVTYINYNFRIICSNLQKSMDCTYVKQVNCSCFTFNPDTSSYFYLGFLKNRLRIIQEKLYTGLIINQFPVPNKEVDLQVDNFILTYNQQLRYIMLTLSNHLLIYSLKQRNLAYAGQLGGRNPYFVTRAKSIGKCLYFSATQQRNIYAIDFVQAIKNSTISTYSKFRLPPEVQVVDLQIMPKKLVAICRDNVLRIWDLENQNNLKGVSLEGIGSPICLSFSKNYQHLFIGTSNGFIQGWDGDSLGVNNTQIFQKAISNQEIRSLCWFHYCGQAQSRRFLTYTSDGKIKLYSFYFERRSSKTIGQAQQLSLLYINKSKLGYNVQVQAHQFANFLMFSPGIMLYMVDQFPKIYYPTISHQITHTFESLVPNKNKQIIFQRDFFFFDGLQIKRVRDHVQNKVSLRGTLQYDRIKVLKIDYRPCDFRVLNSYKFLISSYFGGQLRFLLISNVCLQQTLDNIQKLKQYKGNEIFFLGSKQYSQPLIFVLQPDKQTVTILAENKFKDDQLEKVELEEKKFLQIGPGEIKTIDIKLKVRKVYLTPFRNHYVVLYQSDNVLRFSKNISTDAGILDYQVYGELSLRFDYTSIIINVIWTARGQIGAVICLDKVVLINSELKIIRSTHIAGYIVDAQWIGYTLVITTHIDVQYIDVMGKSLQLYCLEGHQSKYLIMGIFADRILGIQKKGQKTECKMRYFNLMQPLLSGYLSYHKLADIPIQPTICKNIIQAYAPYYLVSENFLNLLNDHGLSSFSQYFIDGNTALYSRKIRAKTLNKKIMMQRFIEHSVWMKHRNTIMEKFLSYWQLHDSSDQYYQQKAENIKQQLAKIVGKFSIDSILNAAKNPQNTQLEIATNFGQKSLAQVFYDMKDGAKTKMQLLNFKAENVGQWVGLYENYLQAKLGVDQETGQVQADQHQSDDNNQQQEGQFKDLLVYYRFDEGKGQNIEDLSDYNNEAILFGADQQAWNILDQDPMQLEDKWGKRVPPQYSINFSKSCYVCRQKKLNTKNINSLTIEMWLKTSSQSFVLLRLGPQAELGMDKGSFYAKSGQNIKKLKLLSQQNAFKFQCWNHLCWQYDKKGQLLKLMINSLLAYECSLSISWSSAFLSIGCGQFIGQITEFRLWKRLLRLQDVKDSMRLPLQIVSQKKRKLKMKLKEKKKKEAASTDLAAFSFPSF